jgi:uncharacterized protein (TIGR00369 family)
MAVEERRWPRSADAPSFNTFVGIERVRMEHGQCVVRLALREHHFNRGGVVHGGVTATLLDSCMGGAVVSLLAPGEWTGTAQLDVQYLRWAQGGELLAEARVVKRGRALAFVEGVVRDAQGKEVARATGTWFVWNEQERPAGPPEGA